MFSTILLLYTMAVATHLPPMRINLRELLETGENTTLPHIDLKWDPFQSKIDRFLSEVRLSRSRWPRAQVKL